jgi:hypothetical protein
MDCKSDRILNKDEREIIGKSSAESIKSFHLTNNDHKTLDTEVEHAGHYRVII